MIEYASAVATVAVALVSFFAWTTGVFKRAHRRYVMWRCPPPHLDPNGEDADWEL